jgi:CheY-like chemotaxis protein
MTQICTPDDWPNHPSRNRQHTGFVHQSGSVIDIASALGEGPTVRLFLPRAVETGVVSAGRPKAGSLPHGSERILLVEDNEQVRAVAVEQLTSLGYCVVETENGDTALALLEKKSGEFDLVFSDMMMPGLVDGFELAQLVLERWPSKKVLLTSGLSGGVGDKLEEQAPGVTVIRKPYRKADLARAVRATLAA